MLFPWSSPFVFTLLLLLPVREQCGGTAVEQKKGAGCSQPLPEVFYTRGGSCGTAPRRPAACGTRQTLR